MAAPTNFRWELDGATPQITLFDEIPVRKIGRGAYRGLEFLEVRAKRIINEIPSGPLPFRFTINAYRGCSHACVYCLAGDTPVLMADGRTRPIAKVRPGDHVVGTQREGRYRRFVASQVLDHWSTIRPAYRIVLEDGTTIVTSADHRFLSDRGWKFVTGAQNGRHRRPHLTTNNRLAGFGGFVESPGHTADYRRGYLTGMIRGDGHVGTYVYVRPHRTSTVHRFRLALADGEALDRSQAFLATENSETTRFVFAVATPTTRHIDAIRTSRRGHIEAIVALIDWPEQASGDWCKGFLAGIFDAEGSYSGEILRFANTDPDLRDRMEVALKRLEFPAQREIRKRTRLAYVRIPGGIREQMRFFQTVDPAITRKRSILGQALKVKAPTRVASIEPVGMSIPMFDITTTSSDFLADGVVSHNCFARPTHDYLGLNIAEDFDTKIVVKKNAVELARAETEPGRWAGESIAMGTNTDPYEAAEGKYRLTRGLVGVLLERGNPFSILTKSPLVLRDIDLITEAARKAPGVRVDFSIGTLDEETWRSMEPGTPHPRKRMDAVATLNAAGVASSIAMGPVLPGLSDTEGQIPEMVAAAVEAGARSVFGIPLHLKPGVKEHYLSWLRSARPDLVALHEGRYEGRSYPPPAIGTKLNATIRRLINRMAPPGHPMRKQVERKPPPTKRVSAEAAQTAFHIE